jgi:hypothetical protein
MGREGVTGALESQSIMLLKLFLNLPVARKRRTVPLILLFLLAEYAGHSIACLLCAAIAHRTRPQVKWWNSNERKAQTLPRSMTHDAGPMALRDRRLTHALTEKERAWLDKLK